MVKPIAAASARRRRQSRPTSAPRCGARPREWLQHGAVPAHPDLLTDLTGLEYGYTIREGRDALILERKEDMKKRGLASPDLADALALSFAYPLGGERAREPNVDPVTASNRIRPLRPHLSERHPEISPPSRTQPARRAPTRAAEPVLSSALRRGPRFRQGGSRGIPLSGFLNPLDLGNYP
jgi:hypothetical protein